VLSASEEEHLQMFGTSFIDTLFRVPSVSLVQTHSLYYNELMISC